MQVTAGWLLPHTVQGHVNRELQRILTSARIHHNYRVVSHDERFELQAGQDCATRHRSMTVGETGRDRIHDSRGTSAGVGTPTAAIPLALRGPQPSNGCTALVMYNGSELRPHRWELTATANLVHYDATVKISDHEVETMADMERTATKEAGPPQRIRFHAHPAFARLMCVGGPVISAALAGYSGTFCQDLKDRVLRRVELRYATDSRPSRCLDGHSD